MKQMEVIFLSNSCNKLCALKVNVTIVFTVCILIILFCDNYIFKASHSILSSTKSTGKNPAIIIGSCTFSLSSLSITFETTNASRLHVSEAL